MRDNKAPLKHDKGLVGLGVLVEGGNGFLWRFLKELEQKKGPPADVPGVPTSNIFFYLTVAGYFG